jgi:endonuclease G
MFHLAENSSRKMQNMRKLTLKKQIKNTKPVFTILVVLAFFVSYGFFYKTTNSTNPLPLETPRLQAGESYVHHLAYGFVYDETHEQAKWIAYCLTKKEASGTIERSDNFEEDPLVSSGTATDGDYAKSGYDRGHLAPAADMRWSVKTMEESFYYSNMSPQLPAFNRGIWKKLEEKVRDWAVNLDSVLIVTGPILTPNLPSIGANKVSIPAYYFKAIVDFKGPKSKGIAFVMPNQGSKLPLMEFAISINELEKLTNIDFFYQIEDKLESTLESTVCKTCWP